MCYLNLFYKHCYNFERVKTKYFTYQRDFFNVMREILINVIACRYNAKTLRRMPLEKYL